MPLNTYLFVTVINMLLPQYDRIGTIGWSSVVFADDMVLGTIGLLNIDEAELGRLGEKGAGENRDGREGMGDRPRELGWLVISIEILYSSRFFSSAMAVKIW